MTKQQTSAAPAPRRGAGDRLHAWIARFGLTPKEIRVVPEPLWTGDGAAARRLVAGTLRFQGSLVEAPGASPWAQAAPTPGWAAALHGFDWLDDAAAAPDAETRARLVGWLFEWIRLYGDGGPGWRPGLAGRRLTHWLCHAPMIFDAAGPGESRAFLRSIGRQARFLRRRWRRAPAGLERFHAAAGLAHAGLALGRAGMLADGVAALGRESQLRVGGDGGLPSRCPEEVMEALAVLSWAARSLESAGIAPAPAHLDALERLATAVRALRFGDGALARFHGGGGGDPERIDRALAASGVRAGAQIRETMGFHRIASGRTAVIFDAGEERRADGDRRASLFCVEAAVGRWPLIVNCGPGARFGEEWLRAARSPAAHSGLSVDAASSARQADADLAPGAPGHVNAVRQEDETGLWLIAEHDGWLRSHGLIHQRRFFLSADGGDLRGEDRLSASGPGPRAAFDAAARRRDPARISFTIRFHLHPSVGAEFFLAGSALRLHLPARDGANDGETWIMRQSGGDLALEESVYLDERRAAPRATKQIVVRARTKDYSGVAKWTFRRAETARPC
ncbi:heparinase II/III family protein [Pikeienuella sp. HZG-20]|uniref:heparinase II/III family protein n=1 Tax=Paludibacillus litoralis TaxID=3133267 RepID=UPI0030EE783F